MDGLCSVFFFKPSLYAWNISQLGKKMKKFVHSLIIFQLLKISVSGCNKALTLCLGSGRMKSFWFLNFRWSLLSFYMWWRVPVFTFLENIIKAKPQIKLLVLLTWHPLCVLWNIGIFPGENVYVCMFSLTSKEPFNFNDLPSRAWTWYSLSISVTFYW